MFKHLTYLLDPWSIWGRRSTFEDANPNQAPTMPMHCEKKNGREVDFGSPNSEPSPVVEPVVRKVEFQTT